MKANIELDEIELKALFFLTKVTNIANQIYLELEDNFSVNSKDKDFFTVYFLKQINSNAESIVYLSNKKLFNEAIIIARNLLEGLFYFVAFLNDDKLATDWRYFGLYEDCEMAYKKDGEAGLNQRLVNMKKQFGVELVEKIEKKYKPFFNEKNGKWRNQNWYNQESINKLVKSNDSGLNIHYDNFYSDFSKITHWTTSGIIGGKMHFKSALMVSFQAVFEVSKSVNDSHSLSYNKDIEQIYFDFIKTIPQQKNISK